MSWVAIPESFGDDPRLIELGHESFARLVRLWCYCGRHENDGIIAKAVLLELIVEPIVERLVQRGFITIEGETAHVVGFLDDNMTHAARQAQRDAARAAGILSGKVRREKAILERTNRSTNRSTSGRTPGPGPILGPEPEKRPREEAAPPLPSPSAPSLPAEKPPKESPEQTVHRYMTTAPRNDDGQDRVWRYYAVRFFVECGSLPTYPTKRGELNTFRELCKNLGPEEVCRRLGIYFDDPPWALQEGGRDLERFLKNFDKLAVGAGKNARRTKSDRSLKFQFSMREMLSGMNHAPALASEYRDWLKVDEPQPTVRVPCGDERFALTTPEEDPRDPF